MKRGSTDAVPRSNRNFVLGVCVAVAVAVVAVGSWWLSGPSSTTESDEESAAAPLRVDAPETDSRSMPMRRTVDPAVEDSPNGNDDASTHSLPRGRTIQVLGEGGQPVPFYRLLVRPSGDPQGLREEVEKHPTHPRAVRNADGQFLIREPSDRIVDVWVSAPTYEDRVVSEISLADRQPLIIRLTRGPGLRGRVLDMESRTLADLQVFLHLVQASSDAPQTRTQWTSRTNQGGVFRFDGLPSGRFQLAADQPHRLEGPVFEVSDGLVQQDLLVPWNNTIEITVQDVEGIPQPGALIELRGPETHAVRSDISGRVDVRLVEPGSYQVSTEGAVPQSLDVGSFGSSTLTLIVGE